MNRLQLCCLTAPVLLLNWVKHNSLRFIPAHKYRHFGIVLLSTWNSAFCSVLLISKWVAFTAVQCSAVQRYTELNHRFMWLRPMLLLPALEHWLSTDTFVLNSSAASRGIHKRVRFIQYISCPHYSGCLVTWAVSHILISGGFLCKIARDPKNTPVNLHGG